MTDGDLSPRRHPAQPDATARDAAGLDAAAPEAAAPDPSEPDFGPEGRPESEPPVEERRFVEFFGLPAMILLVAIAAVIKGIVTQQLGFTIVGAVVAAGIFAAIGLAMTIAKRG